MGGKGSGRREPAARDSAGRYSRESAGGCLGSFLILISMFGSITTLLVLAV